MLSELCPLLHIHISEHIVVWLLLLIILRSKTHTLICMTILFCCADLEMLPWKFCPTPLGQNKASVDTPTHAKMQRSHQPVMSLPSNG